MALLILRFLFILVAGGLATIIVRSHLLPSEPIYPWLVFLGVMLLAAAVISIDVFVPQKQIDTISAVYFGTLVGLFLTFVIGLAITPFVPQQNGPRDTIGWFEAVQLLIGMVLCYTCISLLLQTKDDFRFIIPYVEFAKEVKGARPYILDTSAIIDGRIADVVEAHVLDNQLIMPRFVLNEIQGIADSSDKLRRSRGRRGLDILSKLRNNDKVEFSIYDREMPEMANQPVDMKLVLLAKHLECRLITGDYNLNKVAKIHSVTVINLNDLANALKPVFLPGEALEVRIVKRGEEEGQGVGYLDDGTMVVVEGGREHQNNAVRVAVTSVLQTSAGRMIFGKYDGKVKQEA
jgi:uncharacterized protein YacL